MLSISTPLSVVAVETMAIVATVAVAESMAVVATVQEVGVGLGLRCGLSLPLAVVGKGGDNGGVLLHDGLTNSVGDDGAGANGQGSLAGIVNLGVESGGTKDGGNLMDSSLQVTVVTGNGLVASNGNRDGSVGSNNVGLHGGGDGLVSNGLGSRDNSRGSIGVGSVGVADDGSNNSGLSLSLPLAVVSVAVGVSVSIAIAESMAVVSTVQEVRVSLSLGLSLSLPLAVVSVTVGVSVSIAVAESMAIVSSVQEVRVSLSLGVCLGGSL